MKNKFRSILCSVTLAGSLFVSGAGSSVIYASSDVSSVAESTAESVSSVDYTAEATASYVASQMTPQKTTYPFTITTYNYAREKVQETFDKAPEKVWVQNQNNIEIMLKLGLADKIVGACGLDGGVESDLQSDFSKLNYYDNMPSKEDVIALEPDFIMGWYSTFDDKRLGDIDFWQSRGVNTYMSLNSACTGEPADHPRTVENEMQDILTIGQIFDVQDKAVALVEDMQSQIDKITDYLKDKDKLSIAMLEDEGGSYRVYGEDTLGGDVAIKGGAELAVGKHGENDNISAEDLIAANPDAIFMVWYNGYTVNDEDYAGADKVTKLITDNPAFQSMDAVKNNRVFPINLSGIYCSGIHTVDGILDVSQNLYPDLYK